MTHPEPLAWRVHLFIRALTSGEVDRLDVRETVDEIVPTCSATAASSVSLNRASQRIAFVSSGPGRATWRCHGLSFRLRRRCRDTCSARLPLITFVPEGHDRSDIPRTTHFLLSAAAVLPNYLNNLKLPYLNYSDIASTIFFNACNSRFKSLISFSCSKV